MPKAGKYDYPTRDLDLCISALQKANKFAKETSFTREAFATAIGQSPKGGGFNVLVGSLSMYQLVDTGEKMIRYTELGKTLILGEEDEKLHAKKTAVRNIVLFSDIFDKFQSVPSDDQLRLFLRTKAGVDISEVNIPALEVGKLFKRCIQYLQGTDAEQNSENGGETMEQVTTTQTSTTWKLISPYGSTLIKDSESFDAVEALLKVAKNQFKIKKEPSVTDSKDDSNRTEGDSETTDE